MGLPPDETEKPESKSIDIASLDLYQLVNLFIMLLSEQALRHLGLSVDPHTNETKKDLTRAHLAIDCIVSLTDKIEPNLTDKDKDQLRSLITDLQLKYAQQLK